jgi:hypothetical protein
LIACFFGSVFRSASFAAAGGAAIAHFRPVALPLFAPDEWTLTDKANLVWQILLFGTLHCEVLLHYRTASDVSWLLECQALSQNARAKCLVSDRAKMSSALSASRLFHLHRSCLKIQGFHDEQRRSAEKNKAALMSESSR